MTREEFLMHLNCIEQKNVVEKLTCTISEEDYKIIEFVYTWHPAISETNGKEEIATLYYMTNMGLIMKMYAEAHVTKEVSLQIQRLKNEIKEKEDLIYSIKERYGAFRVIGDKI